MKRLIYTSVTFIFTILLAYNLQAENNSEFSSFFIYCPSDIQSFTDPGMCSAMVYYEDPIVLDTAGIVMIQTDGLPSGSMFPKGETYNRFEAIDSFGNMSECGFYVFVDDVEPPQIYCQSNISVNAEPGSSGAIVENIFPMEVWDNCQVATIEYYIEGSTSGLGMDDASGTMFNSGTSYVWYIATDTYGNMMECGFEVNVIANDIPDAICQDISVELDADGWVDIFPEDIDAGSTADGGVTLDIDVNQFTCMDLGIQTATLLVSDVTGSFNTCTSNVIVMDNQVPMVSCTNMTVTLDEQGYGFVYPEEVGIESWDNCGIEYMGLSQMEFTSEHIGENLVTLTVMDMSGNSDVCTATITVEGPTQDLDVICPASTTIASQDMMCGANVGEFFPDITSTSPNIYITYEISGATTGEGSFDVSGTMFNIGTSTVIYTVTDDFGNTHVCTSDIEVIDAEAPYIESPGGFEMPTGPDCMIELPDFTNEVEAWDNCGSVVVEQYPEPGTMLQNGEYGVEIIATDESGNVNFDVMYIYVYDAMNPEVVCQDMTVTLNSDGVGVILPDQLIAEAWDNCGIAEVFASNLEFNESHIGMNEVTLSVMDYNGNMTSCTAMVTVQENPNIDDTVIGDLDFDLYPNPTLGTVTVNLPRPRPGTSARVLDITGKLIYETNFDDQSKIRIDLEDFDNGIYTISVFNQNQSATKRVIKTK